METEATNQATQETRGRLVTYDGAPVVTYFFSTSGGQTEDVENTTLGTEPRPWLRSVEDPYDDVSPKHRWGPIRMTFKTATAKLRGIVLGRFRGIEVLSRGTSPRVVEADVIGTRGTTRVDGATLRARFGLFDTWAYFTSVSTQPAPPPGSDPATGGTDPDPDRARVACGRPSAALVGSARPAAARRDGPSRRTTGGWRSAGWTRSARTGATARRSRRAASDRVLYRGVAGAPVRVPAR